MAAKRFHSSLTIFTIWVMDHSYNLVVSLGEFNVLMILVFKVNCSIKWNNPISGIPSSF